MPIGAKVRSGRYATPGEAVLDAVRFMQDAEKAELRASVMQGGESGLSEPETADADLRNEACCFQ